MLRAGPFSDERIVRLANRRFVPFYFDLSNRGVAGDPAARKFVVKERKRLGGRSVPTPPVLFMSPDGEVPRAGRQLLQVVKDLLVLIVAESVLTREEQGEYRFPWRRGSQDP